GHVLEPLLDDEGRRLLQELVGLRHLLFQLAVLFVRGGRVVANAFDLAVEPVDDDLVDDRRPDEDAEAEGEKYRDERDDVEAKVNHRSPKSLGGRARPPGGGFRFQNQPVMFDQVRSQIRRNPSRNTWSECDAATITTIAAAADPTSKTKSRRRTRPWYRRL